jgi:hypothetical protein
MDDIHLGVERSGFSISVQFDFSKAFDSMSHDLLLLLGFKFGLSSTVCRLFGSFLCHITKKVMIHVEYSDSVDSADFIRMLYQRCG